MKRIILFQILLSFVQLSPLSNPIVEVGDRDIINININQHCHDSQCQQNIKLIQRNVSQELIHGAVIMSTTGVAAEYVGNKLGLFHKEHFTVNGAPVYKQMNDGDSEEVFLFRGSDKSWYVGKNVGSNTGWMRTINKSTSVPKSGWQYMQKNHWYNDWGLKVEGRSEVNSKDVCNSLRIGGDAGEFYQFLGQYDALDGFYSEGRMIYKSNRGKYLRLKSGKNVWTLCDDIECNNARIASGGGANSMNPANHRAAVNKKRNPTREAWGYVSNGKWKNLKNLVIKCRN